MNKNLENKLNEFLANQQVNYIRLHNMHWYITGKPFFVVHSKLEELYDVASDIIDVVGERILALGGRPVASLKKALEIAQIREKEDVFISGEDVIRSLLSDNEYWIHDCKEIIKLANELEDEPTADIFVGYLKEYQKLGWMLKAFLNEEPYSSK